MVIFHSYVKLPEGSWHLGACCSLKFWYFEPHQCSKHFRVTSSLLPCVGESTAESAWKSYEITVFGLATPRTGTGWPVGHAVTWNLLAPPRPAEASSSWSSRWLCFGKPCSFKPAFHPSPNSMIPVCLESLMHFDVIWYSSFMFYFYLECELWIIYNHEWYIT